MRLYQSWLKTFFIVFLSLLSLTVFLNALGDPMLVLPFVHRFNNRVRFINERQQKTNQLFFTFYYGKKDFDSIILGSSRSTGINPALFEPEYHTYNYAAAAFRPSEALTYLNFAQQLHGKDLKLIVLGLDFMASNGQPSKSRVKGGEPVSYIEDVHKPFFTLAHLFNLKALHLSTRILRANRRPTKEFYYERKEMRIVEYFRPGKEEQQAAFRDTMNVYRSIYKSFCYNPDYKMFLQEIKKAFPNTQFLVFTTPVALPHLQMIEEENILPQYKQWLRDITDVFGEVWHFMDKNTISQDYTLYFSDSHHLYPEETNLLVQRMLNKNGEQVPADFGKKLTTVNIDAYLEKLSF